MLRKEVEWWEQSNEYSCHHRIYQEKQLIEFILLDQGWRNLTCLYQFKKLKNYLEFCWTVILLNKHLSPMIAYSCLILNTSFWLVLENTIISPLYEIFDLRHKVFLHKIEASWIVFLLLQSTFSLEGLDQYTTIERNLFQSTKHRYQTLSRYEWVGIGRIPDSLDSMPRQYLFLLFWIFMLFPETHDFGIAVIFFLWSRYLIQKHYFN